jgi:hypothetical protein
LSVQKLYFVAVDQKVAATSEAARRYAAESLIKHGFVGLSDKFFLRHPADWAIIGGRWSGLLSGFAEREFKSHALDPNGAEDDAVPVTKELLQRLQTLYAGTRIFIPDEPDEINIDDALDLALLDGHTRGPQSSCCVTNCTH